MVGAARVLLASEGKSKFKDEHPWFVAVCHAGMFLESIAFFQSDIYYLRVVEMTAAGLIFCYTFVATRNPLDCHAIWSLIHIAINLAKILQVKLREWHALRLIKPWDREVWQRYFQDFTLSEFVALFYTYEWVILEKDQEIIRQGEPVEYLWLVFDGTLGIFLDDRDTSSSIASLRKGQFIGEMAYFTGEHASASVRSTTAAALIRWDMHLVHKKVHTHSHSPEASAFRKLPSHFCRDLTRKMRNESRKSFAVMKMRGQSFAGDLQRVRPHGVNKPRRSSFLHGDSGAENDEEKGGDADTTADDEDVDDNAYAMEDDIDEESEAAALRDLREEYEQHKQRLSSITLGEAYKNGNDPSHRTASAVVTSVGRRLSNFMIGTPIVPVDQQTDEVRFGEVVRSPGRRVSGFDGDVAPTTAVPTPHATRKVTPIMEETSADTDERGDAYSSKQSSPEPKQFFPLSQQTNLNINLQRRSSHEPPPQQ